MPADALAELMLEHAWRYFELHAKQRIAVFNYFLVISGALAAGIAAALQASAKFAGVGVALGLLLPLVSFIFWKLDQRVSFLIKHAETALAEIEHTLPVKNARLFSREPSRAELTKATSGWWARHWTYSQCFRLIFGVMSAFGLASASLAALRFMEIVRW